MVTEKTKQILFWILASPPLIMLILSAIPKIIRADQAVADFTTWGMLPLIVALGLIEIISVILYIIPRTRVVGLTLISAYLGGAIATNISFTSYTLALIPAIMLSWVLVCTLFMRPSLLAPKKK